jgi:apolipoprotein N-acyltransferase
VRTWMINAGLLVTGVLLTALSQGEQPAAWAAITSAFLLLCYLDRTSARIGLIILLPLFLAAYCVAWFGVVPDGPIAIYAAIVVFYGVPYFIPFLAHRILSSASPPWLSVLIFPSAWTSVEYALQTFSPYGSWMSLAYSQDAGGPFAHLASLGGAPLVTFFLTAVASAAASIIRQTDQPTGRPAVSALSLILSASVLLSWSEYQVRTYHPARTVMVASVVANHALQDAANTAMVDAQQPLSPTSQQGIRAATDALNRGLLEDTARFAAAGARIVAWPEASGMVRDADEPAFLTEAAGTAHASGIYLFVSYIVWRPGQALPIENKVAAIDPGGRIVWTFRKAHPIVALEDSRVVRGDADLRVIDTPFGRIGLAICHDFDFPEQIRRASRGVDLLIDPSNDWSAIEWLHANMHRYRATENGVPLFRPTDHGAGIVADRLGRTLHWQSTTPSGGAFITLAPVGASPTPYSRVGGWLAWIVGFFLALAVLLRARSARGPRLQ